VFGYDLEPRHLRLMTAYEELRMHHGYELRFPDLIQVDSMIRRTMNGCYLGTGSGVATHREILVFFLLKIHIVSLFCRWPDRGIRHQPAAGLLMVGRMVSLRFLSQVCDLTSAILNCSPGEFCPPS
jgi:hypothetical protein